MLIWIIFVQIVVFAIAIFSLKRILHLDTSSALNRLSQEACENKKMQDELKTKREELEKEYQSKVSLAEGEAKKLKQEAASGVESIKKKILEEAYERSDEIIKSARSSKESMRQEIRADLEKEAVEFSGKLIEYIFSHKLLGRLKQELIEEIIAQIEEIPPAHFPLSPKQAEIVSNCRLQDEQIRRIREILSKKISSPIDLEEKEDKSIIAGIIIKLDSLVIDGTLSTAIREAAEKMKVIT